MHIAIGISGCVVSLVAAFFLWATLHELAHYVVLKRYRPSAKGEFKLYPHKYEGKFFWARISWKFRGPDITLEELAWVSIAPRWPDIVGMFVTAALACALGWSWWSLWLIILVGGSIVDLLVGSGGINPESDLQRTARGWNISPWILRVIGVFFGVTFAAVTVAHLVS